MAKRTVKPKAEEPLLTVEQSVLVIGEAVAQRRAAWAAGRLDPPAPRKRVVKEHVE